MSEIKTVWFSRWAFTGKITEHQVEIKGKKGKRVYLCNPYMSHVSFYMGKDAHESREEAVKAAQSMLKKKITEVKKQLVKLESKKF